MQEEENQHKNQTEEKNGGDTYSAWALFVFALLKQLLRFNPRHNSKTSTAAAARL
jgi:hypothetical protein